MTQAEFRKELKSGLSGTYLFYGDEEYLKKFYADRGQEIEDSVLQRLSEDTIYMTTEIIGAEDYALGSQWPGISDFLLANGKIDDAGRANVEKNIDASLLAEATGLDIVQ